LEIPLPGKRSSGPKAPGTGRGGVRTDCWFQAGKWDILHGIAAFWGIIEGGIWEYIFWYKESGACERQEGGRSS